MARRERRTLLAPSAQHHSEQRDPQAQPTAAVDKARALQTHALRPTCQLACRATRAAHRGLPSSALDVSSLAADRVSPGPE